MVDFTIFLRDSKIYLSSWKNNNYKFQNLTLPSQYNTTTNSWWESFKHGVRMGAPVFKTLHLWWFLAVLDSIHYLHYILIGSPKRHTSPNSHGAQSSILITWWRNNIWWSDHPSSLLQPASWNKIFSYYPKYGQISVFLSRWRAGRRGSDIRSKALIFVTIVMFYEGVLLPGYRVCVCVCVCSCVWWSCGLEMWTIIKRGR